MLFQFKTLCISAVALIGVLALAGCGTGDGDGPRTGSGTLPDIEVDTFVLDQGLIYLGDLRFRVSTTCTGTTCTVTALGETDTVELEVVNPTDENTRLRGRTTRNGMSVARVSDPDEDEPFEYWAGWGAYQIFSPVAGSVTEGDATFGIALPVSMGEGSSSNPAPGSAAWEGAMLGTRYGPTALGRDVIGDARLTVDFALFDIDVAFTGIRERVTGRAVADMTWDGLTMANGAFRGPGIEGQFYGPAHEEAGGVFDSSGILGAFGAKRE